MRKNNHFELTPERKSAALWGGLSFVIPAAVMAAVIAVCGITPFGDATLITDAGAVWFENLQRLYEAVVSGEGVFYHLNVGFGSSLYSEFAAGLCSPFLFFTLFFGSGHLAAAYSFITVLRAGAAGLAAWYMLRKCAGSGGPLSFALACGYALCGFTACAAYYPSIADAAVFFPLLVTGIFRYVYESRPFGMFLSGALFFLTAPRLLPAGIVMGLIWYAAFYCRRGVRRQWVYRSAMFAATLLCAAAAACVLIVPMGASAVYYRHGAFAAVEPVDPAAALCFGGYGTVSSDGGYSLCAAGLLLMGIVGFLLSGRMKPGERLAVGAGIAFVMAVSVIKPAARLLLGFCAYGGEKINAGFLLALLAVYSTARYLEKTETKESEASGETQGMRAWHIAAAVGVTALLAILSVALRGADTFAVLADGGLMVVFAALFVWLSLQKRPLDTRMTVMTAAVLTLFGLMHCGAVIGNIHSVHRASALTEAAMARMAVEDRIAHYDSDAENSLRFFRRRSTDGVSDGVDLRRSKIAGLTEFAESLGIMADSAYGGADNFTPLTDVLFGVGYCVDPAGNVTRCSLTNGVQSPAYVLPYDDGMPETENGSAFERQNRLARDLFHVGNLFTPTDAVPAGQVLSSRSARYRWTFGNDTTEVCQYAVTLTAGDSLYLLAEGGGSYGYAVADDSRSHWKTACAGGIYELTTAAEDGTVNVYLCADQTAGVPEPTFAVIRAVKREQLGRQAEEASASYISRRGSKISFMLSSSRDAMALTSVPYEYGWKIKVNGKKTAPVQLWGGLIGIPLSAGDNSIVMTYQPPFFRTSLIISAVLFALGVYMTLYTEHEAARRRKVRMAFRAVELRLSRDAESRTAQQPRISDRQQAMPAATGQRQDTETTPNGE